MSCECGCGESPTRGDFLPGHDQRLRSSLEKRVGGLLALRTLVESAEKFSDGRASSQEHLAVARGLFKR
jgi:hypothetical protein